MLAPQRCRRAIVTGVVWVFAAAWTAPHAAQDPQERGRTVITSPRNAYPERPTGDPAALERGRVLYATNCAWCHGADIRGGESGPSLLRSSVVLDDQQGELIAPIVRNGRPDRGMPRFAFATNQISDLAVFVHSFKAAGYDESRQTPSSIVVGDAPAGAAFFAAKCASCHSATGDLKNLASRIPEEKRLQQTWLMPGSGGGARFVIPPAPTAAVTSSSGERVEGTIEYFDDFTISLVTADGGYRSFRLEQNTPKIDIHDPLEGHRRLLPTYSDRDIHNVTAYLVTLK